MTGSYFSADRKRTTTLSGAETGEQVAGSNRNLHDEERVPHEPRDAGASNSGAAVQSDRATKYSIDRVLSDDGIVSSAASAAPSLKYPMSPVSSGGVRIDGRFMRPSHYEKRGMRKPSPFWTAKANPYEDFSYRSFYSVLPTTNRFLERKEHIAVKILQKRRLGKVVAKVDTGLQRRSFSPPSAHPRQAQLDNYSHGEASPNAQKRAEERHRGKFDKFRYSKEFHRMNQEALISNENKRLLERLMHQEPRISDSNFKKNWHKTKEYQNNIRKYPPGYWTYAYGDASTRTATIDKKIHHQPVVSSLDHVKSEECAPINVWTHPKASPLSLLEKATVALEHLKEPTPQLAYGGTKRPREKHKDPERISASRQ